VGAKERHRSEVGVATTFEVHILRVTRRRFNHEPDVILDI